MYGLNGMAVYEAVKDLRSDFRMADEWPSLEDIERTRKEVLVIAKMLTSLRKRELARISREFKKEAKKEVPE